MDAIRSAHELSFIRNVVEQKAVISVVRTFRAAVPVLLVCQYGGDSVYAAVYPADFHLAQFAPRQPFGMFPVASLFDFFRVNLNSELPL